MIEFEVIEIIKNEQSFVVNIETPDRKRQGFAFPYGDGWEDPDEEGNPKFIQNISDRLEEAVEKKKKSRT